MLVEDGFAEAAGIITWGFDSAVSIIAPTLNVMGSHRSVLVGATCSGSRFSCTLLSSMARKVDAE